MIVWPEAWRMSDSTPADFEWARLVLSDLTSQIADPEFTAGRAVELAVILDVGPAAAEVARGLLRR